MSIILSLKKFLSKFEITDMRNNSTGNESEDVRIMHTSELIVQVWKLGENMPVREVVAYEFIIIFDESGLDIAVDEIWDG